MTQTIVHVPASEGGGSFDPTDIELTDDTSGAFLIKEGSNEYMRINTTDGSELTQLKVPFTTGEFKLIQETSAGPYEFIKANATSLRLFPGSTGGGFSFNEISVNTAGVQISGGAELRIGSSLPVSGSGARTYISTSGQSWTELLGAGTTSKIQRVSDGLKMLEVDTDTNATFTLADSSAGVFKVENPNESYDYLNINEANNRTTIQTGTTISDYIILKAGGYEALQIQGGTNVTFTLNNGNSANFKVKAGGHDFINVETASGSEFIELKGRPGNNSKLVMNNDPYLQGSANQSTQMASFGVQTAVSNSGHRIINKLGHSTNYFQVSDSGNAAILKIEEDSDVTFTLDSGTTKNFKVVDDAGSPTTYIDIESGSTEKVKIPVVGLQTIRAIGSTYVLGIGNTNGVTFHTYAPNFQNHVPADLDQTDDGTTVALGYRVGATVTYGASASAAATTGITLTMQAGLVADGSTSTQHLVLHNQNATHSAKFILDGSAQYSGKAVATAGTDAADLVGSGFTLAAGKFAIFEIVGCRVNNTNNHYFYAVKLHTKT